MVRWLLDVEMNVIWYEIEQERNKEFCYIKKRRWDDLFAPDVDEYCSRDDVMVEAEMDNQSSIYSFFWICGRSELRRSKEVKATRSRIA